MMMIDGERLWEPYSKSGCTFDMYVDSVTRSAAKRGLSTYACEAAIYTVLLEISDGKAFSQGGCTCGCGLFGAHSDVEHYTIRKAVELDGEVKASERRKLEDHINAVILRHIENDNAAYLAENMPPEPETKPDRVGVLKNAWNKIWSPYR